jgi:23S rRNA (adenine2030-N6)-methyltransferase
VGNARRASPLSGGGSLRLPGQAYGDGPRARGEGEQGRGPRAPAAGQRAGDAAQGDRKAAPRSAGSGTRTQARKAGPNAETAPRAPFKRNGSGRS